MGEREIKAFALAPLPLVAPLLLGTVRYFVREAVLVIR